MPPKSVPVPMITRVRLKNFRSIAECDVELGPLTILVGPNGSGKSNFLHALDFVSDALNNGLESAVRRRGGMNSLMSRWELDDIDSTLAIEIEVQLAGERRGSYLLELKRTADSGHRLETEECRVEVPKSPTGYEEFKVDPSGRRRTNTRGYSSDPRAGGVSTTLTLPHHADHVHFGSVYRALAGISMYSFHVSEMRTLMSPDGGERLASDGANVASMLSRMAAKNDRGWSPAERIIDFMSVISGRVTKVYATPVDRYLALRFDERLDDFDDQTLTFDASEVSYGTLRTLGVLVALYQGSMAGGSPVTLVGIEEPETAVHPGAATALFEAMDEASLTTQVLATSHSAAMLDRDDVELKAIRAVAFRGGRTMIGSLDSSSRRILEEQLYTVGELLAMKHLQPDEGRGNRFSNGTIVHP